jgi:bifunctional non-homologous end joining protein LigD
MPRITIDGYDIEVSNPDKIIYPKDGITKLDVVHYYARIAPYMFRYAQNRLISMQRFPDGIGHEGFYQKEAGAYFPDWVPRKTVKKEGGVVHFVVCDKPATLVYLASQLVLVPHLWLSRVDKLNYPDRLIFDLDPSGTDFNLVMHAAKQLKNMLEHIGLTPFVMTTGSRGLHVVVPLQAKQSYATVRTFARTIATIMAHHNPQDYTIELRKDKRKGRVFIDYLRNGFGATAVAPYALRALEGAPIATPLSWAEVRAGLSPQKYTIKNIFTRLNRRQDPWHNIDNFVCVLPRL